MTGKKHDALRTLRLAARRVRACEQAVSDALARPEEIRRLELQTLSDAVEKLQRKVREGLDAFPVAVGRNKVGGSEASGS